MAPNNKGTIGDSGGQVPAKQHGVKGTYVGGDWVDLEDCAEQFNIKGGSHETNKCGGDCSACPRSRSRNVAVADDGTYDVIIVGAGCIGSAIARELSKYKLSVLMLEAADDVTQGATKGNSGIVHAGFDDKPGTNRAKYCWPGNQMFADLDHDLHFGYQKNGSLVLAKSDADIEHLKELKKRGETNGVKRLQILSKDELFKMEPHVHPDSVAALWSPDAGNLIPYEYAIALAENAVDNGVELRIRRQVSGIEKPSEDGGLFTLYADHWEPKTYADKIPDEERVGPGAAVPGNDSSKAGGSSSNSGMAIACVISSMIIAAVILKSTELAAMAQMEEHLFQQAGCTMAVILPVLMGALGIFGGGNKLSANRKAGEGTVKDARMPIGKGGRRLTVEEMKVGGSGSMSGMDGVVVGKEQYKARYIVNAAGSYSDKIAAMIGDNGFTIKPRLGDYLLLNRNQGYLTKATLFPCPGPLGKGVLVQTTLWGNLILGPTARDQEFWDQGNSEVQEFILSKCKALVPTFDPREVIHAFCGARAKSTRGDWIIEPSTAHPQLIHAAGIDSPGLAGSPAIALEIVQLLSQAGLKLTKNRSFNPKRAPIIVPKDGFKGIKMGPPGKYTNPEENIVCKCEKVTEAEIITAMRRSLPLDSTQTMRKRTRAGMGHCQADQGNYGCECRVADIIARENGYTDEVEVSRRPWPATSTLDKRWIDDADRNQFERLMAK